MKKIITAGVCVVSMFFSSVALAGDTIWIGIITDKATDTLAVFDEDGNKVYDVTLTQQQLQNLDDMDNQDMYVGDFLDVHAGVEYIGYSDRQIDIKDDTGQTITSFAATTQNYPVTLTVGDVDPNYAGEEIVVCQKSWRHARLKIFAYNQATQVATQILSIKPYEDRTEMKNKGNGCNDLAIGDVDHDGDNEIVAARYRAYSGLHEVRGLDIFDAAGNVELTTAFKFYDNSTTINIVDIDGDGLSEIAYSGQGSGTVHIMDSAGESVADVTDQCISGSAKGYGIGDLNADGAAEIVMMCGAAKSKIEVMDAAGAVLHSFAAFPNGVVKRDRMLLLNDFTTFL